MKIFRCFHEGSTSLNLIRIIYTELCIFRSESILYPVSTTPPNVGPQPQPQPLPQPQNTDMGMILFCIICAVSGSASIILLVDFCITKKYSRRYARAYVSL